MLVRKMYNFNKLQMHNFMEICQWNIIENCLNGSVNGDRRQKDESDQQLSENISDSVFLTARGYQSKCWVVSDFTDASIVYITAVFSLS